MSTMIPSKFAKIAFALVMAIFGAMHFLYGQKMSPMIPEWLPMPILWVYLTGAALIAYGAAIILNNKLQKIAGYLLAVMLFLFIIIIHLPNMESNADQALPMVLKDLALAFVAIFIANNTETD